MTLSYCFSGDEPVIGLCRKRAAEMGLRVVDELGDAEVAVTYRLAIQGIEDAYFDDGGLLKNVREGALLVDLSAATPSLVREISAIAQVSDLRFVEAPLAVRRVEPGGALGDADNLVCYAAGDEGDVEEVRAFLERLACEVVFTGAPGSAQLEKARHTMRLAASAVAEVEADALLRMSATGTQEGGFRSQAAPGAHSSPLAEALSQSRFDGQYSVALLLADVAAAVTAADDVDLIVPQLESAMRLLELIAVIGGADKGVAALSLLYRDEAESARAGLDWSRAEGMFGGAESGGEEWGEGGGWDDWDEGPDAFGGYFLN